MSRSLGVLGIAVVLLSSFISSRSAGFASELDSGTANRFTGTLTLSRPGHPERGWRFDLIRGAQAQYQLLLFGAGDPATVRRALWVEASGDILLWDGNRAGYGPVASLEQGIELALGPDAALGFSWLLAVDSDFSASSGPDVRTEHWVDPDSGELNRTETTIASPRALVDQAMDAEGLGNKKDGERPPRESRFTLEIESSTRLGTFDGAPRFTPPGSSVFVARWAPSDLDADDISSPLSGSLFGEVIEVSVASLVTRVVDSYGEPILDLGPEDFQVRLGRQEVAVLAVDWIDQSKPVIETLSTERTLDVPRLAPKTQPEAPLIVFFTQAGLDKSYTTGALRFHQVVDELIAGLPYNAKIGVVAFDSQLRLRQDFTDDRPRIMEALERSIRFGGQGTERRQRPPSLAATLDFRAAQKAASPEVALRLAAEALGRLPGEKTMIYLGWGLGTFSREGVRMTADYEPARRALRQANTTVFVLDTTDADFHSLEVGLQQVARDTGGTYEKTNQFPRRAAARLGQTLGGYYLITVDRSGLNGNRKEWRVDLRDGSGTVLVAPTLR